jgi:hypothetical protein
MDPTSMMSGKLPSMSGGAGGSTSSVTNVTTSSGFNNSGWTVGSGAAKVSATAGMALSPWMIAGLAAAGLVAVYLVTKK